MPAKHIAIVILSAPIAIAIAFGAWVLASSKDDRVSRGSAYGFVIGETVQQSYDRAIDLRAAGAIAEFRVGRGSNAALLDAVSPNSATRHDHWRLVVDPDWWNNAINLTFEDGKLVEIWRFRLCCEMP